MTQSGSGKLIKREDLNFALKFTDFTFAKFRHMCILSGCDYAASMRDDLFWNTSTVKTKFSIDKVWIKSVRKAKNKPNYGMGEMDSLHEKVCENKLELSGPLVDSYLRKLGESLKHKQTQSKATGLTNPTTLFIPWMVFRHIMTVARGYGCEVDVSAKGKKVEILIKKQASARKIFCPSRFSGQNYLHQRKFRKQTDGKDHYAGRSSVVVTKNTPITLHYNNIMTTNR